MIREMSLKMTAMITAAEFKRHLATMTDDTAEIQEYIDAVLGPGKQDYNKVNDIHLILVGGFTAWRKAKDK